MISLGILSNYKYTAGPASKQNYIIYISMPVVYRVLEYVHVILCQVLNYILSQVPTIFASYLEIY